MLLYYPLINAIKVICQILFFVCLSIIPYIPSTKSPIDFSKVLILYF
ncbi:hypothetical protein HMPREF2533_00751 [Bacteroides fragilis]|nr:hypothetical protein HMPREF2530_00751 [Bacteroides fragilis]KXU49501.1 hypothetical protein HMPREF2533_00751 [Bacteroides fragilis]